MRVWPQRFWFLEFIFVSQTQLLRPPTWVSLWEAGVPLRSYPRLLPKCEIPGSSRLWCAFSAASFIISSSPWTSSPLWMGHSNLVPSHPSSGYKSAHMTCSHLIFCQVTCDPRSLDFLLSARCISLCPLCLVWEMSANQKFRRIYSNVFICGGCHLLK